MANEQTTTANHSYEHGHEDGCGVPQFNTEDIIVREDIMAKTKELAEMLFTSEEVQQYRRAEQQIQGNDRIQEMIAKLKKKQKEIVAFETTFKNADMVKKIEAEIETLQDELDGIPIITEFQQSQADINYLLQTVVSIIRDTVAEKINMEDVTSEDPENCDV
ncbi:RicAFT regulatory complex protein RicA family protein [Paenibacillus mendelii]|uniref:RicAFT regulatory complex protein RicA family protein n=1 Tax=Paenibacillus mendelii TaxID=206163 RepID=A0ABV6JGF2_9BACL|nr:YlbF family regulator [Paenibacillus mendelii]MCQ6557834.1 YlbF family regulator [Paenibacillus mendelii]